MVCGGGFFFLFVWLVFLQTQSCLDGFVKTKNGHNKLSSEGMERKRPQVSEDEEEKGRRISPRKKMRAIYSVGVDNEVEEDSDEQPGPSTLNTHKQIEQRSGLLPVTCGNKKGILDPEKFRKSERCIGCEGRWFTPPEFEQQAGKGSCRKWKATILYENQPLQFWLKEGQLTTKGFNCRQARKNKQKTSGSSSEESEIQSAEETEEDDVEDQDWLPDDKELVKTGREEGEEGRVGAEKGGEVAVSDVDKSEEEDKADTHNEDKQVSEEMKAQQKMALQREVKVIITRLPKSVCFQASNDEDPSDESRSKPLHEDAQTQGGRAQSCSTTDEAATLTAAAHTDPSLTSDSPIAGCVVEENREEFTQSQERQDELSDTKTETENCPTPPSAVNFFHTGLTCDFSADLTSTDIRTETDKQTERISLSGSEASGPFKTGNKRDATTNTSSIQKNIKAEKMEAISGSFPTDETSDTITSGHDEAELHVIKEDTRSLQESQTAGNILTSAADISCNLDTIDLDQLRRQKMKMQLKVLKLQEEYYTLKIQRLKK